MPMSFGCFSKEGEKFQNRILNTQSVRFKEFKQIIHSCYSKSDPQMLINQEL